MLQCCAVLWNEMKFCVVQWCTVQCSVIYRSLLLSSLLYLAQCSTVHCSVSSTMQCSAVQWSAVQCSAVQYSAVHYSTVEHSRYWDTNGLEWLESEVPSKGKSSLGHFLKMGEEGGGSIPKSKSCCVLLFWHFWRKNLIRAETNSKILRKCQRSPEYAEVTISVSKTGVGVTCLFTTLEEFLQKT